MYEDQLGTLVVGNKADVIILKGNPLENISVMDEVFVVIKNGELVFSTKGEK